MSFANEIITKLKLEDKDWKKALDSISQAEKQYYNEAVKNTSKLIYAKEDLAKIEEKNAKTTNTINSRRLDTLKKLAKAEQENNTKAIERYEKRLKKLKDIEKRIKLNSKVQLDASRQEVRAINNTISAQAKAEQMLSKAKKRYEDMGAEVSRSSKAHSNLTNQLVRHLRQIETLIVAYYTLSRAWDATIGKGLDVNKIIESNTMGIAALISANTKNIDSLGNTLTPLEKFTKGQEYAKDILAELRKESVKTYATFPQLIEIFQQATGQTLSMGDAFGMTLEDINKNTIQLATRMSNIAGSIGMPMDRVREEIRSLLSANASTDSLISTMLFGSPGEANKAIRMAKDKTNGLTELLNKMLEPFDILADTRTYQKGILTLQNAWETAMGDMVQKSGLFNIITDKLYDLSEVVVENTDGIVRFASNFGKASSEIARFSSDIVKAISSPLTLLKELRKESLLLSSGRISGLTPNEIKKQLDDAKKILADAKKDLESEGAWDRTISFLGGTNESQEKAKVAQAQAVINKLQREYNKLIKEGKVEAALEAQAKKELTQEQKEALERAKATSKLLQNGVINTKLIEENTKLLGKHESEIVKYQKLREQNTLQIKKYEEEISKLHKNDTTRRIILEDQITELRKHNVSLGKLTAEENSKKALEKTKELVNQKEIELKIKAIMDGQINSETYQRDLAILKVERLTSSYQLLKNTKEEQEALVKLLEAGLELDKLDLEIAEKKNKIQIKSIEKQFKRDVNKDATLTDIEGYATTARKQLIDIDATERQLAKFEEMVKDSIDTVKDNFFENEFDFTIKINTDYSDETKAIKDISKNIKKSQEEQKKWNKYIKQYEGIINSTYSTNEEIAKAKKDFNKNEEKHIENQINGYANIAGAASQMFEQGSREAAAFQAIESGLALATGIRAILTQGSGDPYTAFARMAAMAATVSSLLSSINVAFGSNTTSVSSDAFSAMAENTGTGTVLGDTSKASESIKNSLSVLEDFAQPQFRVLSQMNKSLESIDEKIGGVSALLIQQGGYAFGEGATLTSSSKQNISLPKGVASFLDSGGSFADKIIEKLTGFDINILGGITNRILGGLFGKTSVSQSLTDYGINFNRTLLTAAIKKINGQAFQTITTTVTKKSWFHSSSSTSIKTYFTALNDEIERQFSLVLKNLYDTTLQAGEALDTSSSIIQKKLSRFVVRIGKISTKDKTGEEIQEQISNIFSKIGDDIVRRAFPGLIPFQQVGEGLFETLTRVSTGMEEAEYYIDRLGVAFDDLKYTQILNKQGNVGFEALYQSITKTDEALYGMNNNLIKVIDVASRTAEELYSTYIALDKLRDRLKFLSLDTQGLSLSMIRGAGSIADLQDGFKAYFENFLTEEERVAFETQQLREEFEKAGIIMPQSKEAFKSLLNGIDLTTESGQELYGRLIILSSAYEDVASAQADYTNALLEQKRILDELAESIRQQVYGKTSYDANKFLNTLNAALTGTVTDEIVTALQNQSGGYLSYIQSTARSRTEYESQAIRVAKLLNQISDTIEVPSFDVGSTYVPQDMNANIHRGEMIIPQTFAEGLRNGSVSMSNNYEINNNLGIMIQNQQAMLNIMAQILGSSNNSVIKSREMVSVLTQIEEAVS